MNPVLDAIGAALKTVNAILSVIPALVWAIALALALGYGGVMHLERDTAVKAKNEAIGAKQQIEGQLKQQKVDAAKLLHDLTDKVLAQQKELNDAHQAQEIESEKRRNDSKAASVALGTLAARNGGRLRDPNAGRGSCGAGPASAAAASSADRAGDTAAASGVLSEPLSRLLQWVADDAQRQADAYAVCREDSLGIRRSTLRR